MRARMPILAAIVVAALAGCGQAAAPGAAQPASSPLSSPSTGPTINYGQQYLADIAPFNTALDAAKAANPTSASDPSVVALRNAAQDLANKLLRQQWPANATTDVHALAVAVAKFAADMSSDELIASNGVSDSATSNADGQAVRADLGLPAPTAS